jgi:hypothetical protein
VPPISGIVVLPSFGPSLMHPTPLMSSPLAAQDEMREARELRYYVCQKNVLMSAGGNESGGGVWKERGGK